MRNWLIGIPLGVLAATLGRRYIDRLIDEVEDADPRLLLPRTRAARWMQECEGSASDGPLGGAAMNIPPERAAAHDRSGERPVSQPVEGRNTPRIRPLRELRTERMLPARDLARAVGVSQATIAALEAGRAGPPTPSLVRAIAAALGVAPEAIAEFRVLRATHDRSAEALTE